MAFRFVGFLLLVVGCTTEGIRPAPPPAKQPGTLRVATWNIENFPKIDDTPERVAEVILRHELDLVALEEIASESAFFELASELPDYRAVLSTHTYSTGDYQKLAFLYRADALEAKEDRLLFEEDGFAFPRPPLQVRFQGYDGFDFFAIAVHLKAGGSDDDRARRAEAIQALTTHGDELAKTVDEDVMILGDYNELLTTDKGRATFAPLLDQNRGYFVATLERAMAGDYSFVPSQVMLDHVVTSGGLKPELLPSTLIPSLDVTIENYEDTISDHLPVIVTLAP